MFVDKTQLTFTILSVYLRKARRAPRPGVLGSSLEDHIRLEFSETQEGTSSVRFASVLDFSKTHRFGSVRFGNLFVPVMKEGPKGPLSGKMILLCVYSVFNVGQWYDYSHALVSVNHPRRPTSFHARRHWRRPAARRAQRVTN